MNCTPCAGTGFLNYEQLPGHIDAYDTEAVLDWLDEMAAARIRNPCSCHKSPPCYSCVEYVHDIVVCDCCGDGEGWYGEPGQHNYTPGGDEPIPECG